MSREERIGPFEIHWRDDVAIMVCPEYLDDPRREDDEKKLLSLVDRNETVVCDVTRSVEIVSRWLKFLCRMSERSAASGKRFVLVGVQESVRSSADYLGISDRFQHRDSIDEALQ